MTQPLVSCITPTYGRFHLLEEMYWCWLNQTYDHRELIIINDQPNLEILCDDPRVKVFNFNERFAGLGAKRNFAIEHTQDYARYIIPFDDDDLMLPNHIETLVAGFTESPGIHRTKNFRHYIARNNDFDGVMEGNFPFFGASCFEATKMKSIKFEEKYVMGEDVTWIDNHGITTHHISHPRPTFVYRQGMGIIHASGHHIDINNLEHQKQLYDRIAESIPIDSTMIQRKLVGRLDKMTHPLWEEIIRRDSL